MFCCFFAGFLKIIVSGWGFSRVFLPLWSGFRPFLVPGGWRIRPFKKIFRGLPGVWSGLLVELTDTLAFENIASKIFYINSEYIERINKLGAKYIQKTVSYLHLFTDFNLLSRISRNRKRGSVAISAPIKVFRLDSDCFKKLSNMEHFTFNREA